MDKCTGNLFCSNSCFMMNFLLKLSNDSGHMAEGDLSPFALRT